MAINVKSINNGQPRSNPYGKITTIAPSFSGVDYYDCYVPYALTNEQLGGYSIANIVDGSDTYSPMAAAIRRQRVANHPASRGDYVYPGLSSYTITHESSTQCKILNAADSNGVTTKFYMTAIQPFFMRKSVGKGIPTDGYYSYSEANRGQLIDVILTNGTCIHCVVNDVNSIYHTNCGNNTPGNSTFANTSYGQYHNIVSCIGGNTLELSHASVSDVSVPLNAFSRKYGLGTWGVNGTNDIAFYRMYNRRLSDGFTLADSSYANVSYTISDGGGGDTPDPTPDPTPEPSTDESTDVSKPILNTPKGIKGLVIDFNIWKNGTHLIRVGDYVTLKAYKNSSNRIEWQDITDKYHPVTYTPLGLKSKYGISYTSVNNGFIGKFIVKQKPVPVELGGTGVRTTEELVAAILGTNNAPNGYDYSDTSIPSLNSSSTIVLPVLLTGHCTTAEARSASRGGLGSPSIGDQAQAHKTKYYDDQGEVSIVYDRSPSEFTALYRLTGSSSSQAALYKVIALSAANHAWFCANNAKIGYNYYANGQEAVWNYIKASKQSNSVIQFGNFAKPSDTNCINFCRLMYAASFSWSDKSRVATLSRGWTTRGVLSSNTLESLGFKKFSAAYAKNPANFEIGDILLKEGHAALVVDVGGRSWIVNGKDLNPENGEVKT